MNLKELIQPGRILVSTPALDDAYFKKAVVLIIEHNEAGTIGFVMNKLLEATLQQVSTYFDFFDQSLCLGGPVNEDSLFFIHKIKGIEGAIEIKDGVFWGGKFEQLADYMNSHPVDSNEVRFFIGYTGWAEGQLLTELNEKSWILADIKMEVLMEFDYAPFLWQNIIKTMPSEYAIWANLPDDPSMN